MLSAIDRFDVKWIDRGREPQEQADPRYPDGIDLDLALGHVPNCKVPLPYPAKRCGLYMIKCNACGVSIVVTTAGRRDDPRSVRVCCERDKMQ